MIRIAKEATMWGYLLGLRYHHVTIHEYSGHAL